MDKDKLKELAQPLCDYLYDNGCPHDIIVVTQEYVEMLSGVKCEKFEFRDQENG